MANSHAIVTSKLIVSVSGVKRMEIIRTVVPVIYLGRTVRLAATIVTGAIKVNVFRARDIHRWWLMVVGGHGRRLHLVVWLVVAVCKKVNENAITLYQKAEGSIVQGHAKNTALVIHRIVLLVRWTLGNNSAIKWMDETLALMELDLRPNGYQNTDVNNY